MNKHVNVHIKASPNGMPTPAPTAASEPVLEAHTGAEGEVFVFEAAFADKAETVATTVTVAGMMAEPLAMEVVVVEMLRKSAKSPL